MIVNIQLKKVFRVERDVSTKEGDSVFLRFTFENGYEMRLPIEHIDYVGINFETGDDEEKALEQATKEVDA